MIVSRSRGILFVPLAFVPLLLMQMACSAPAPAPTPVSEPAPRHPAIAAAYAAPAVAGSDLSGRYSGTPGADGSREVVVIETQSADGFAGRSFFEDASGTTLGGGQGTLSGSASSDGQVTFTISRDDRELVWTGRTLDAGRTLTGRFEGFSTDATYRRP